MKESINSIFPPLQHCFTFYIFFKPFLFWEKSFLHLKLYNHMRYQTWISIWYIICHYTQNISTSTTLLHFLYFFQTVSLQREIFLTSETVQSYEVSNLDINLIHHLPLYTKYVQIHINIRYKSLLWFKWMKLFINNHIIHNKIIHEW